ncbi:universal stress protein [Streptococcus pneumoniae]|nr:universal stress protein [Streptococcus pneumoniae]
MLYFYSEKVYNYSKKISGGFIMAQRYQNIMVAIDGSKEADLAFVKGVHSALRNDAKLTIAHVIDTRALQSVSTFDAEVYEELQVDAESLMKEYEKRAKDAGVAGKK